MANDNQNGWNEYSKLVLKELETLADGIDNLRGEIQEVKQEMVKIQAREDRVEEIKLWKERLDDIASPSQLKNLVDEVESLKVFKTRAITIFTVVQFAMAATVWVLNVFFK
jgi:seryl-tRNA synthetase